MRHTLFFGGLVFSGLVGGAIATPLVAQEDGTGGAEATAEVEQRLTAAETGTFGETRLSFGYASETRNQRFTTQANLRLRQDLGSGDIRATDPRLTLSYSYFTRASTLDFTLSYSEAPVIDTGGNAGSDPAQVFIGGGERQDGTAALSFTFGQEAPFGGTLAFSMTQLDFSDTTDATLIPADTRTGSLDLRFEISPRVTLTAGVSGSETTRELGTDVTRERAELGLDLTFSEVLTGGLTLGQTRLIEDGVETEGSTGRLRLGLARPNGNLSLSYDTDISTTGRRDTLEITRAFELRQSTLTLGLGASRSEQDDLRPLYKLSYAREGDTRSFTATLSQAFAIDSTGNEALNSNLSLDFTADLSTTTAFTSRLGYANSEVISGTSDDTERFDLSLGLSREVSADWRLTGGINFTETRKGQEETRESEVFIGLRRGFSWRP